MSNLNTAEKPVDNIVNRLPAAVFEYTYFADGRKGFTYISPYSQTLFGLTSEVMMNGTLSLRSFIHPDDRDSFVNDFQNCLESASTFLWEGRVVTKEKEVWISALATPFKMLDRVVWTGVLSDITARKQAEQNANDVEQRAQAAELKYGLLLESLPLGVGIHQNGVLVYANSQAAKIMRANTAAELIGKPVLEMVHPDYRPLVLERIKNLMNGVGAPVAEEKFIRLDGVEITVETYAVPFQFNGKPAVQIVVKDITEQQLTKQAIRKTETLFSQLFHNSPFGNVMLDEHGKVVLVNGGFERMFGYAQFELQGKELNQFIVPDNLTAEGNDLDSLISAKQIVRIDTSRKRKDGSVMPVMVYGVPIQLENRTIGIFGSYVDVTEQKRTEEELKIRNAELDNFVYKVSHDLRAPLSSVLGLVNLARLEGNNDNLGDYVKIIGQKIKQLDGFISDVLSHSKNLKLDLKIEAIDFKQLIDHTFTNLSYLKGVDEMKKSTQIEGSPFHSDPWRLGEIFRNLISNAIKYRDETKPDPSISINIHSTAQQVSILFSDNGIGIDDTNLPKIFEMFYRASHQSDGSGLGLYIVKNAVDKLGGTITVSSHAGEGTSFELKLPNHILATANHIVSE
ncbi:MAG: PAS domain S-box protein [Flammeovirgaceae bacterium]